MVMPFGTKSTGVKDAPAEVDFTHLWNEALRPAIEAAGYRAVRADQDLGTVILKDMLERLVASNLVVADVSLNNANVYYELGVRHAANEIGCVMIAADWARPVFDIAQITRITYPLPDKKIDDATARTIKELLTEKIAAAAHETSPVHRLVDGYPAFDRDQLGSFRDSIDEMYEFQTKVRAIELLPAEQQAARRRALIQQCLANPAVFPLVASDLLELTRDTGTWQEVLDFIDQLPKELLHLPFIEEQWALAASKLGMHADAIARLEMLINRHGATPELQGLLGGRYKALYATSHRARDLDAAIAAYEAGMRLDLNAYYPACNLPRLLRQRGAEKDFDRAKAVLTVVIEACEAAREAGRGDTWLNATLLGAAFDLGDAAKARELLDDIKREGLAAWMADTTMRDLEMSVAQTAKGPARTELERVLAELKQLANGK